MKRVWLLLTLGLVAPACAGQTATLTADELMAAEPSVAVGQADEIEPEATATASPTPTGDEDPGVEATRISTPCDVRTRSDLDNVTVDVWAVPESRSEFLGQVLDCLTDAEAEQFLVRELELLNDGGGGAVEDCMAPKLRDRSVLPAVADYFLVPEQNRQVPEAVTAVVTECALAAELAASTINFIEGQNLSAETQACMHREMADRFVIFAYNDNGVRGRFGVTQAEFDSSAAESAQTCLTADEAEFVAALALRVLFPNVNDSAIACTGERLRNNGRAMFDVLFGNEAPLNAATDGYFRNAVDCVTPEQVTLNIVRDRVDPLADDRAACLVDQMTGETDLLAQALAASGPQRVEFHDRLRACLTDDEMVLVLE